MLDELVAADRQQVAAVGDEALEIFDIDLAI
jgi:hypothetical protein